MFVNIKAQKWHFIIAKFNYLKVHLSKLFCRTNIRRAIIFSKSIVVNFFKKLLLLNRSAKFKTIPQVAAIGHDLSSFGISAKYLHRFSSYSRLKKLKKPQKRSPTNFGHFLKNHSASVVGPTKKFASMNF